ncbi:hypothetical protein EJB05_23194, partial [Eragrostis curvula]
MDLQQEIQRPNTAQGDGTPAKFPARSVGLLACLSHPPRLRVGGREGKESRKGKRRRKGIGDGGGLPDAFLLPDRRLPPPPFSTQIPRVFRFHRSSPTVPSSTARGHGPSSSISPDRSIPWPAGSIPRALAPATASATAVELEGEASRTAATPVTPVHGGSSSGGGRWRGERSRGRPPSQPHYRYRPVDAAHRHSLPSTDPPYKSSPSGAVAPAASNKEPDDKANRNAANFECNVCFDMAAEPVVTKCGHLFCWECLYQWLHVHSHHRECPVCKGQVADDAIIPIYGRGGSAASVDNAPPRPTGARVESSRQQQHHHHHLLNHWCMWMTMMKKMAPLISQA